MTDTSKASPPPARRGIFSPLGHAVFRRIWFASLTSNLGLMVMGVGAAWAMTEMTNSPEMVALVQASLMGSVVIVMASLLLLISYLDQPYAPGVGRVRPVAMERSLRQIEQARVALALPAPPCDALGEPEA